jgi:hypothetical protein
VIWIEGVPTGAVFELLCVEIFKDNLVIRAIIVKKTSKCFVKNWSKFVEN